MAKKKKQQSDPLAKSWFQINAKGETPELFIFDEIGLFGVAAKDFIDELNAIDAAKITVRINSPGGSVGDGLAIYNAIKRHPAKIHTSVEGVALSIASLIACAGDPTTCAPGAVFMLHSPWTTGEGNAKELRKTADALDATQRGMITAYIEKTGLSDNEIISMLEAETWLSAEEAVELGLCDHIEGELMAASHKHLSKYEDFQVKKPVAKKATDPLAALKARNDELTTRASGFMGDKEIRNLYTAYLNDFEKTADDFSAEAMRILGRRSEPTTRPSQATIGENNHHGDFIAAATDALAMRYGAKVEEPHPAAADIRNMSVLAMAETILRQKGERTEMLAKADLVHRAVHTTSDFPYLLKNSLSKVLVGGYETEPASHAQWVNQTESPDFKEQSRISRSDAPELEKVLEAGEYTYGSFGERQEVFTIAKYGRLFKLSWEALVNDDLGAFSNLLKAFGASARRKEADLVYNGTSGLLTNPNMSDGTALFHADHSNIVTSTETLGVATLGEARALMRLQKGQNGAYLNIVPKYLIVPVALESTAEVLLSALAMPDQANPGVPNVKWINSLELVVEPRLDDSDADVCYLAASPTQADTYEVSYLEGERGLFFEEKPGFESDDLTTKARLTFGVAPIDWRGLVKLDLNNA